VENFCGFDGPLCWWVNVAREQPYFLARARYENCSPGLKLSSSARASSSGILAFSCRGCTVTSKVGGVAHALTRLTRCTDTVPYLPTFVRASLRGRALPCCRSVIHLNLTTNPTAQVSDAHVCHDVIVLRSWANLFVLRHPVCLQTMATPSRSEILESKPIGDGLSAFRGSHKSGCELVVGEGSSLHL
jgi:hypothetical protein